VCVLFSALATCWHDTVAGQTAAEVARQQCASHVGWELAEHTLHTAQKYGQKILQLLELTLAQRIFANALYSSLLLLLYFTALIVHPTANPWIHCMPQMRCEDLSFANTLLGIF